MKVFVVNCGSSSIKYQLFDMSNESVLAKGLLERVGSSDARSSAPDTSGRAEATAIQANGNSHRMAARPARPRPALIRVSAKCRGGKSDSRCRMYSAQG